MTRAVIGTVVPAALYHLRRLCRDWFDVEPLVARSTLDWGFEIKVDSPAEVGADRLLNALAAHQRYAGPLIVIDFGTATTFDVVDADGAYIGGVIAPGINLSIEALHQAAARLPRIGIGRPQAVIGRSTVPAMQSGIYWGYIGMIEGLVTRIQRRVRAPDEGAGHRRSGAAILRGHHHYRPDRPGPDLGRAAAVGGAQPHPHIAQRPDEIHRKRLICMK